MASLTKDKDLHVQRLQDRLQYSHTPCFCEENVYRLCRDLAQRGRAEGVCAVFISNAHRQACRPEVVAFDSACAEAIGRMQSCLIGATVEAASQQRAERVYLLGLPRSCCGERDSELVCLGPGQVPRPAQRAGAYLAQ